MKGKESEGTARSKAKGRLCSVHAHTWVCERTERRAKGGKMRVHIIYGTRKFVFHLEDREG